MKINLCFLSVVLVAAVTLHLPVQADPRPLQDSGTLNIKTGTTSLSLDEQFAALLNTAQASFKKIIPGRMKHGGGELTFPISGGAFDLTDLKGEILHSGGFTLSEGTTDVSVSDLIITTPASTDTTTLATVSALVTVNGTFQGRVNLFNFDLTGVTAPFSLPHNKKIALKNLSLTLTADGATALNTAFGTTTFTADTVVGTASINAITSKGSL